MTPRLVAYIEADLQDENFERFAACGQLELEHYLAAHLRFLEWDDHHRTEDTNV